MMNPQLCTHPQALQVYDRPRGIVTCSQCGEVVTEEAFELDPAFGRGETRGPVPMRNPGFARPGRSAGTHTLGTHRPSVQAARAALAAIARQLDIPPDHVEIALGVYKAAVNTNCVSGARNSILCACLYIVCRRKATPHMILDFSDVTGESPYTILKHLKTISVGTSTPLPPVDPSFYLTRLAAALNLGDAADEVTLFALKILRTMQSDWIHTGRRPLGPCAAALIVACRAAGIDRNVSDISDLVRLSDATITLRLSEFLNTDAAQLSDIDQFVPSDRSNPMAFVRARQRDDDYAFVNGAMELSELYWQLVEGARNGLEATEERCEQWKAFWDKRQALNRPAHALVGANPEHPKIDSLDKFSHQQQLELLGLKHVQVVSPKTEEDFRRELSEVMAAEDLKKATQQEEDEENEGGMNADANSLLGGATGNAEAAANAAAKEAFEASQREHLKNLQTQVGGTTIQALRDKLEIIVLPDDDEDGDNELDPVLEQYIIFDNEIRLQREAVALKTFGQEIWDRGAPKEGNVCYEPEDPRFLVATAEEMARNGGRLHKRQKRRRADIIEDATAVASIAKGLKGRGAGQIDIDGLANLLGGGQDGGTQGSVEAESAEAGGDFEVDDDYAVVE